MGAASRLPIRANRIPEAKNNRRGSGDSFRVCIRIRSGASVVGMALGLQPADDYFQKLARAARQSINFGRICGTSDEWGEDILAAKRDLEAGESDGMEQLVMVDFTKTGPAIFVFGKIAMILDAEAANLAGALLDVWD